MPQPSKIPLPFAASGDKNTIPENTETTGLASWREGFPAITSAPFSEGGVAPKRADFNGIFNTLSLAILWQQQGGFYAYDATTDYEVGNVVLDAGGLYVANAANGPSSAVVQPSTDTTGAVWKLVRLDFATQSAAGYMSPSDKSKLDGLISTLATPTAAGYMSAADKTALNTLLAHDSTSHAATLDDTTVASDASFEYRNYGALTLLIGKARFLTATSVYNGRRIAYGVPESVFPGQLKTFVYFDNTTYYGAWASVNSGGNVFINTRAVQIPANLLFYVCILYPRAL